MKRIASYIATAAAALGGAALLIFAAKNDFGLARNMEMLVNMMRELSVYYVDEVDADRLMADAAEGMVRRLDPYTVYMPEEEMTDFQFLTTGKYGGVGALIRKKGDGVVIAQPYKGFPADRAGLRIGDRFVEIAGKDARAMTTEQVSALLKGTPNTTVTIKVEKLLTGKVEEVKLRRERIAISGVGYAGFVADGVGYIQHRDFTEGCYEDMRAALERLQRQGLQALVLDYRNNGGGILQEAVKIVSMFVPKGTEVVTTKGRTEHTVYRTQLEPIAPTLPVVALVNDGTASAAEIVTGALQDLDRAVLVGQRTFGKGLVQTTRPLGYNSFLKVTTAKYYIPSGRCIQALDYSSRDEKGAVKSVPDSLGAPIRHARRPQGLRRRRHHARRAHRTRVHQPVRYDALCDGLCRRFRRRLLPRTRGADDRSAHVHPHRRRLRAVRGLHGGQGGGLRVGHAPCAQPHQGGGQGPTSTRSRWRPRSGRSRPASATTRRPICAPTSARSSKRSTAPSSCVTAMPTA